MTRELQSVALVFIQSFASPLAAEEEAGLRLLNHFSRLLAFGAGGLLVED